MRKVQKTRYVNSHTHTKRWLPATIVKKNLNENTITVDYEKSKDCHSDILQDENIPLLSDRLCQRKEKGMQIVIEPIPPNELWHVGTRVDAADSHRQLNNLFAISKTNKT